MQGGRETPAGERVEAEGGVDLEVADNLILRQHLQEERSISAPTRYVTLPVVPRDRGVGRRDGVAQDEVRGVLGNFVGNHPEDAALVVEVVGSVRQVGEGRSTRCVDRADLEEVVEVGIGAHYGVGIVVVVRVQLGVVRVVVRDVKRIQAVGNFPAVDNPVVIRVAVNRIGTGGDFLDVREPVVIRVLGAVGGVGVERLQDVRCRDRLPVVALTERGIARAGGNAPRNGVDHREGVRAGVGVIRIAEPTPEGELLGGTEVGIGVALGAVAQIHGGPEGGVDLHVRVVLIGIDRSPSDAGGVIPEVVLHAVDDAVVILIARGDIIKAFEPVGLARVELAIGLVRGVRVEGLIQEDTGRDTRINIVELVLVRRSAPGVHVAGLRVSRSRCRDEGEDGAIGIDSVVAINRITRVGVLKALVVLGGRVGLHHDVVRRVARTGDGGRDGSTVGVNHVCPAIGLHVRGVIRDLVVRRPRHGNACHFRVARRCQAHLVPRGREDIIRERTGANHAGIVCLRVDEHDPRRVGEPVALAVCGVQRIIAPANAQFVTEGRRTPAHCAGTRAVNRAQASIRGAELIRRIACAPAGERKRVAIDAGVRHGRTLNDRPRIGAEIPEHPPIRDAVAVIVAEIPEVTCVRRHIQRVAGEIFRHEDCLQDNVFPILGTFGGATTGDERSVDRDPALIDVIVRGEQGVIARVPGCPLIEEGVPRCANCRKAGRARSASGKRHRLHQHGGIPVLGERIVGKRFAERPVEAHVAGLRGLGSPTDIARAGEGGGVHRIEGEPL